DTGHGRAGHALRAAQARLGHHLANVEDASGPPAGAGAAWSEDAADSPSLEIGLRLVEQVACRPWSRARELALAVGCSPERVARLLASAGAAGLIEGTPSAGYRASLRLGGWYPARLPARLAGAAGEVLSRLADEHGICAYLTTLVGAKSITVAEAIAPGELRTASWLNRPFPLTGSDGAPALVSAMSDPDIVELFTTTARPTGRRFPRTAGDFLTVVHDVRRDGSVMISEYGENGLASVTSPVHGLAGEVAAAVCLVGPPREVEAHRVRLHREAIGAAETIGRRLAGDALG
ncbi:IclR family transcriptional regulator C-terminal domain-containing protein, partial [Sphaerisporangium sp. NPDC051011]|uniref:IclR family transcriptional regulator domain-containing protein n=1 Tax=Sphaerisporangium sp. NPDC051011 TaxID=3155792 RepID=UPI0033C23C59